MLQIILRKLKISAELCVISRVLGSSLEFVPEIFCTESVHDLIGHNGTIKHERLLSSKETI